MIDNASVTLAELAVRSPGAARVFMLHGLDFCCKGRRPLAEACAEKGLEPDEILTAIAQAAGEPSSLIEWSTRPTEELIGHIVAHYHTRLREQLPALVAMADRVEARHADKPTVPRGLADELRRTQDAALDHMEKEEGAVFPQFLSGRGADCGGPVLTLEQEHDDHGAALARIRAITAGHVAPPEACTTWRALYLGLAQLERELMEHIHLENNVLFPRVLCR